MGRGKANQRRNLHRFSARISASNGTKSDGSRILEEGSAILVSHEDKRYLITAGHCLPSGNPDDLTAETRHDVGSFSKLQIKRLIIHKCENAEDPNSDDIAIFEIDAPSDGTPVLFANLCRWTDDDEPECENIAYGFPHFNRKMGEPLELEFQSDKIWSVRQISGNPSYPIKLLIKAFSGSGIIDFNDKGATCVGLIRGLTTENGLYSHIFSMPSNEILQHINDSQTEYSQDTNATDIYYPPEEYIPRKGIRVTASAMDAFFQEAHTIMDFITGCPDDNGSNHIILAGAAQTGKTYELQNTAAILQAKGLKVKLIELRKHPDLSTKDLDFHPDGILILDGLDEIRTKNIDNAAKTISDFAIDHPNRKIIVSCRENFIEKISEGDFSVITLCNLSWKEAEEFIQSRSKNPDLVIKEIKDSGVEDLCTNPFNLTSILKIGNDSEENFKLPTSIIEIYEKFIDSLYQADLEKPEKEVSTSRDEASRLLKAMAFFMVRKGKNSISHDELLSAVGSEENINKLIRNSVVVLGNGEYSFITNGIREYLAAEKLLDLDLQQVKSTVCIKDTETIRPSMHNVVGFWLRHVSSRNRVNNDIIEWVRKSEPRLLLSCLSDSISPATRLETAVQILDKCNEINSLYDAFYTGEFQRLYKFAASDAFNEFLLNKLREVKFPSVDFYNTVCLCACIPWTDSLEEMPDYMKTIYDLLFEKIKRFGDKDNSQCLYYWIASNRVLYGNPAIVRKIMESAEEFTDPETVSMICEIIYRSNLSDEYFDYLSGADKHIHDKGYTIVPRYNLYAALGNVKECDHIIRTLQLILDDNFRYKDYYENEYADLIYNVLKSLLDCQDGQRIYLSLFEKLVPDKTTRFLDARQTLVLKIMERLNTENGILNEITDEIRLLLNPPAPKEESEEIKRQRAQSIFDILWDYPTFKTEVEQLLTKAENHPETPWDLYCFDENGTFNHYLNEFVIRYSNWHHIDSKRIRTAIADQSIYETFRLEKTVEILGNNIFRIDVSQGKTDSIISKATEILTNYVRNNANTFRADFMSALKLFVAGYLDLDKDVIAGLLPFGYESFIVKTDSGERESKTVFNTICEYSDKDDVLAILREKITSLQESSSVILQSACRYLMEHGTTDDKDTLYKMMTEGPNELVAYFLLEDFLKDNRFKQRLIDDFEKFLPYYQLIIWEAFKDDPTAASNLTSTLERSLPSFSKTDRRNTLQKLVKAGDITALRLLYEDKSELEEFGHFYHFNYFDPEANNLLIEILSRIKDCEDYYETTRRSIIFSLGSIAASSTKMLESTCDALQQKFGDTSYSRGLIEYCKNRRLTECDEME